MRNQTFYIILTVALMHSGIAFSQNEDSTQKNDNPSFLYLGLGGGPTFQGYNYGLSANNIFANNWGYSLKLNSNRIIAASLPKDYVTGICFFGNCIPTDNYNSISIHLLREMPSLNKSVRFGFEAGPSIGLYKKATFRLQSTGAGWFGSNYTTNYLE